MKSLAEARIKRARAVELAAQGMSYDEIAHEVGYTHRGSAHRAVFKALAEHEVEEVEQLRQMEMDRLDYYLTKLWPKVEEGDLKAISVAIRITDTRMKLPGSTAVRRLQTMDRSTSSSESQRPGEGNPWEATTTGRSHLPGPSPCF